jgi:hypothetical protein
LSLWSVDKAGSGCTSAGASTMKKGTSSTVARRGGLVQSPRKEKNSWEPKRLLAFPVTFSEAGAGIQRDLP